MPEITTQLAANGLSRNYLRDKNNNLISDGKSAPPFAPSLRFVQLDKGIDADQRIGVSAFTMRQLLDWIGKSGDSRWDQLILRRKLTQTVVTQVSGIGYLSYIYRIQFFFEGLMTPFSTILKVPTVVNLAVFYKDDDFLANWSVKLSQRHNMEISFYEHFGHKISASGIIHVAKLYYGVKANTARELENGCILMEDLGDRGAMASIVHGLDKVQVEQLVCALAQMHAFSLSIPNSEQLMEKMRWNFPLDEEDGQGKFNAVRALLALGHDYLVRHGPLLEQIAREHEIMLFDTHKKFGVPPVLCHGDVWCSNIFFERAKDGGIGQELYALVDWQYVQPNSGPIDLARMILLCANSVIKLRHTDEWLELYYDTFLAECRRRGVPCPYTMSLVRRMFWTHFPSEMLFSIVILMQKIGKAEELGLKTVLIGRMLSSLEMLRQRMKAGQQI